MTLNTICRVKSNRSVLSHLDIERTQTCLCVCMYVEAFENLSLVYLFKLAHMYFYHAHTQILLCQL